jgi:hypothetical protein
MTLSRLRVAMAIALTSAIGLASVRCTSQPAAPAAPAQPEWSQAVIPVLSVRELMTDIVDPIADWVFDAAVIDVSDKGTATTAPTSDEDWVKVERGLVTLAESSNLLKMPRPVESGAAPLAAGDSGASKHELSAAEIQAKIDGDRARWNQHADELRKVALDGLARVKSRDPEVLFKVGGDIDNACENCHLEYWYPGDKAAVEQLKNSTTSFGGKK